MFFIKNPIPAAISMMTGSGIFLYRHKTATVIRAIPIA
jgi:hypothetical protein